MPDAWDSEAGRTHFVGDDCVPTHQVPGNSLPPAMTDTAHHDSTGQDGRADALHIHGKLGEQLETLRLLERKLKRRPDQDLHERVRTDMVTVAIEHVEAAITALLRAGQE